MTSFAVERTYPDGKGGVSRYEVITSVDKATDKEFAAFFARQLREFLHRQGVNVSHISDDVLCTQTRTTFLARGGV